MRRGRKVVGCVGENAIKSGIVLNTQTQTVIDRKVYMFKTLMLAKQSKNGLRSCVSGASKQLFRGHLSCGSISPYRRHLTAGLLPRRGTGCGWGRCTVALPRRAVGWSRSHCSKRRRHWCSWNWRLVLRYFWTSLLPSS